MALRPQPLLAVAAVALHTRSCWCVLIYSSTHLPMQHLSKYPCTHCEVRPLGSYHPRVSATAAVSCPPTSAPTMHGLVPLHEAIRCLEVGSENSLVEGSGVGLRRWGTFETSGFEATASHAVEFTHARQPLA